jgi:hypothetical protein
MGRSKEISEAISSMMLKQKSSSVSVYHLQKILVNIIEKTASATVFKPAFVIFNELIALRFHKSFLGNLVDLI